MIKKGDLASIGRSGWNDHPTERGYWLTLTAPGRDVLPFDRTKCTHSEGVDCSGDIGCVCEEYALANWHRTLPARWHHFVTDLRRTLGVSVNYFKTYEPQQRKALHVHAMLRCEGVLTDKRMAATVRRLAKRHGFGKQFKCDPVDLADARTAARVAGYTSKYCLESADALPELRAFHAGTGELCRLRIRVWSASWDWGEKMKDIHERRRRWGLLAGCPLPTEEVGVPAGSEATLDLNTDFCAAGHNQGPPHTQAISAM